jgi:hypothetical protein
LRCYAFSYIYGNPSFDRIYPLLATAAIGGMERPAFRYQSFSGIAHHLFNLNMRMILQFAGKALGKEKS